MCICSTRQPFFHVTMCIRSAVRSADKKRLRILLEDYHIDRRLYVSAISLYKPSRPTSSGVFLPGRGTSSVTCVKRYHLEACLSLTCTKAPSTGHSPNATDVELLEAAAGEPLKEVATTAGSAGPRGLELLEAAAGEPLGEPQRQALWDILSSCWQSSH